LISHSLPVVAWRATTITVMRAGRSAEIGPARDVVEHVESGYSQDLPAAVPQIPRLGVL